MSTNLLEALRWATKQMAAGVPADSSNSLSAPSKPAEQVAATATVGQTSANQPQQQQQQQPEAPTDPAAGEKLRSLLAGLAGPEPDILNEINKDPTQREGREQEYCDWMLQIAAWRAAGGGKVAGKPGAGQAAGTPAPQSPHWVPFSDNPQWRHNFEKDLSLLEQSFRLFPPNQYPKDVVWEVLFGGAGEGGGTVGNRDQEGTSSAPQNPDRVKPENLTRPFTPLSEVPKALDRRIAEQMAKLKSSTSFQE